MSTCCIKGPSNKGCMGGKGGESQAQFCGNLCGTIKWLSKGLGWLGGICSCLASPCTLEHIQQVGWKLNWTNYRVFTSSSLVISCLFIRIPLYLVILRNGGSMYVKVWIIKCDWMSLFHDSCVTSVGECVRQENYIITRTCFCYVCSIPAQKKIF